MGHAGARAGRGQSRPGGPGLADSPLMTVIWNPVEARSSRGVKPTHTEPQPDTAGGEHYKGGNQHTRKPTRQHKTYV